ncbi:50S ribosomal protein L6 [Beggiatoa leptomitoformis]|uniref:Large ribosomal subunit protein uL6 n=1 Tax=Beggiatoa leptomitoformis TaxID=288004 RepID=A0A2N9YF01_9GAMM|nr:50S ribosomal protein L6 [Beggiatoa leptomitoformis]ALG68583.1 50S ribosomal protein L6 [Beggiatoa leptomitoformis]AUI69071.1 50S ribosomal protein L6 [Beggiatoa leptomitoformis]
MSRIAKNPVAVPKGTDVNLQGQFLKVNGSKGSLEHEVHADVQVVFDDGILTFAPRKETKESNALAGTTRAIVSNMVTGASKGFERKLTLVGVGYRAQVQGTTLNLTLGFSHPVNFVIPQGITIETPSQTEVIVKGADKQKVGQIAANIRAYRPPEPYKGKGVRYANEVIIMKEVKKK